MIAIKVLQIWEYYLPYPAGAAIRYGQLTQEIRQQGIDIEVLTFQRVGQKKRETLYGTRIIRVPINRNKRNIASQIVASVRLCIQIWKKRHQFDVLHSLSTNRFRIPVMFLAKFMRKPVIVEFTLMESRSKSTRGRLFSTVTDPLFRYFDAYIGISRPLIAEMRGKAIPSSKCHLITYGAYPDKFIPATPEQRICIREQLGLKRDAFYMIFVGSFIQRKGIDILIEAAKLIISMDRNVQLVIAGRHDFPLDHPARSFAEKWKTRIEEYGLRDRVQLTGLVEYEQVLSWLQASDLFIFPSRREGLGRVTLEAMSVGLPCICSELGGIAYDIIEPGVNGIVVKELDAQAFADQVLQVIDDKELRRRLGSKARETVVKHFDERKNIAKYRQLIQKIASKHNEM